MIRQNIKGLRSKNIDINMSQSDFAGLKDLMAGEIVFFSNVASGGDFRTARTTPISLNTKSFYLNFDTANSDKGVKFTIPHVKAGVEYDQIIDKIKEKFGCDYNYLSTDKTLVLNRLGDIKRVFYLPCDIEIAKELCDNMLVGEYVILKKDFKINVKGLNISVFYNCVVKPYFWALLCSKKISILPFM